MAHPPSGPFDITLRNTIKIGAGLAIGVAMVVVAFYSVGIIVFSLVLAIAGQPA